MKIAVNLTEEPGKDYAALRRLVSYALAGKDNKELIELAEQIRNAYDADALSPGQFDELMLDIDAIL